MIKIGICRHFLQRVETAASRRDGHSRHPKASHACPARPLVTECVLRESERPNTPTRAERDILSCPKPHSRPQHGPGRRVRRMQKVGEKWYTAKVVYGKVVYRKSGITFRQTRFGLAHCLGVTGCRLHWATSKADVRSTGRSGSAVQAAAPAHRRARLFRPLQPESITLRASASSRMPR